MANFTPILIADNATLRQQKTNDFASIKLALASLVTFFNAIEYKKEGKITVIEPLTNSELIDMLSNTQILIINKMTDGNGIVVGGLKVQPDKVFEITEKPIGYDEFINALEFLKARFKNPEDLFYNTCLYDDLTRYFALDEKGKIINSTSLNKRLSSIGKVFTQNENQNAMYRFIESFFKEFKEKVVDVGCSFKRYSGGQGAETFKYILSEYISSCNPEEGTFNININRFIEVN